MGLYFVGLDAIGDYLREVNLGGQASWESGMIFAILQGKRVTNL
jgi:hypothetical protein